MCILSYYTLDIEFLDGILHMADSLRVFTVIDNQVLVVVHPISCCKKKTGSWLTMHISCDKECTMPEKNLYIAQMRSHTVARKNTYIARQ